jgi:hypothetical protein
LFLLAVVAQAQLQMDSKPVVAEVLYFIQF